MNRKYGVFIMLFIAIINLEKIQASSYGPSLLFHKPYNPKAYCANYYMSFAAGQTDQAYDKHGHVVPFLQQYGSEDILKRFLDPTLPLHDTQTVGTINFSGIFNFQRLNLFYNKNICHNLFINIATSIQNLSVNSILLDMNLTETLTPQEEQRLQVFQAKIPKNINSSGIYATTVSIGYNKLFTNFQSLQFLHLVLEGSLGIPQLLSGRNLTILQYPLAGNIAFSYPIVATVAIGMSQYINFGAFGQFIPFQPTQLNAPVHHTNSKNQLLLTEKTRIQINPKPVFSTVFYVEAHSFVPRLMATAGYGYTYGMKSKIQAFNTIDFPTEIINKNELLNSFSISSLFFQLNYDFACDSNPHAPSVSLFYTMPLAGSFYPKIQILGGSYNMTITYEF